MSRALGRYELLRPIARGGMAEVYLARRRAAGIEKWLVVKRIRAERSGDARFLDLFIREARLSMSLVHQNIVPVFDFGRIDDQVFLAMERVEGKDLGSTLARTHGRRVAPLLAAFVAAECCQALDYAHHRKSPDGAPLGIVHRDVTPRNVLLSWSGEVKLTDFGIAALAGEATARLLGTPAYMAPEQARSEPLDARADVYAIGLILRELLTGQRARPGAERDHLLEAAKLGTLHPWPADLDSPMIAIVNRATSIRPADRFPDARSLLAELDAVIVRERATKKSESPARLLAAWLDEVWAGARDEHGPDGAIEANHLVSFLDDGALDVMGTGTERSLLATAADDPATAGTKQPSALASPDLASPDPASGPSATVEVRPSARLTAQPSPEERPGSQSAIPQRRVGTIGIVAMVLGAAGLGALAMLILREDKTSARVPQVEALGATTDTAPTVASDAIAADGGALAATGSAGSAPTTASTETAGSADHATPAGPDASPNKAVAGANADDRGRPPSGHSRPPHGQPRPPRGHERPGTGPSAIAAEGGNSGAVPVVLRKVTINATPWAYFTIDTDSTRHETVKTVLLAPGKHRIHFSNPVLEVERDVTIEVPADRDTSYVERLGRR